MTQYPQFQITFQSLETSLALIHQAIRMKCFGAFAQSEVNGLHSSSQAGPGFANMQCIILKSPCVFLCFLCVDIYPFFLAVWNVLARLLAQAFYSKWVSSRIKVCAPGARKMYDVTDMSVFRKEESYVDFFQAGEFWTLDELIKDAGHDPCDWSLRNKLIFVTQAEGNETAGLGLRWTAK